MTPGRGVHRRTVPSGGHEPLDGACVGPPCGPTVPENQDRPADPERDRSPSPGGPVTQQPGGALDRASRSMTLTVGAAHAGQQTLLLVTAQGPHTHSARAADSPVRTPEARQCPALPHPTRPRHSRQARQWTPRWRCAPGWAQQRPYPASAGTAEQPEQTATPPPSVAINCCLRATRGHVTTRIWASVPAVRTGHLYAEQHPFARACLRG